MGRKDDLIEELEGDIEFLNERIKTLNDQIYHLSSQAVATSETKKQRYAGALCFDFWPPKDWFWFGVSKWNPGKYFQLNIGPIRLNFFAY